MNLDALGIKALYDQTAADNATIAELMRQKEEKLPIDLDAAYKVESNINAFMEAIAALPWGARMALGQGKLKTIQKQVHQQILELEELSKTQGVVVHGDPTTIIKPQIKETIVTGTDVPSNTDPITAIKEKVEEPNIVDLSTGLKELISKFIIEPKYNGDYKPLEENEYFALIKIRNEDLDTIAKQAYELGQCELINKIALNYEGTIGKEPTTATNTESNSAEVKAEEIKQVEPKIEGVKVDDPKA